MSNNTNIYKALANFQLECPIIHKGTQGHNYTYADLPKILEVINPILARNGLGFTQLLNDGGLRTIIFHIESGETIESNVTIPQIKLGNMNEFQSYGSGITYYRRYSLSSALGLVTDKDTDAAGEQMNPPYLKKHAKLPELKIAIEFCENEKELAKLYSQNKHLVTTEVTALFTEAKNKL